MLVKNKLNLIDKGTGDGGRDSKQTIAVVFLSANLSILVSFS
jgi:hypothetical protein